MRAAGPAEGNRKHHPQAAPPESSEWNLAVRAFSRPQKMVFDCVYGRRNGGCDKAKLAALLEGDSTSLYHTYCVLLFEFASEPVVLAGTSAWLG